MLRTARRKSAPCEIPAYVVTGLVVFCVNGVGAIGFLYWGFLCGSDVVCVGVMGSGVWSVRCIGRC